MARTSSGARALDQFTTYVEEHPGRLWCWGQDALVTYPLLAWLNTWPVVEQRRMIASGRDHLALRALRSHYNHLGMAVKWTYRYAGRGPRNAEVTERQRRALFELAGSRVSLDNLIAEVRSGTRRFAATGNTVTLEYTGDPRVESLDRILEVVDDLRVLPASEEEARRRWSEPFRTWLASGGWKLRWSAIPLEARTEYRREADRLVRSYPRYLKRDLTLGAFTIAAAEDVLTELLARALHSHVATMHGSVDLWTVMPPFYRNELVKLLVEATGRDVQSVERVVELLTYAPERGDDPCLAPLIPVGRALVPMSSLIVPSSLVRNFTALLQRDHESFGEAGRQLGALGVAKMSETLQRLAGAKIQTGIKVVRPDGSQAGDLDVVAYDPAQQLMAIFEVMWQIGPDGSKEIARTETLADKKRSQVVALRDEILHKSAQPKWPRAWPNAAAARVRWFVVTPTVLPMRAVADGITVRSHRMLAYMVRRGASVADVIGLMDRPHYPPDALAKTNWHRLRYGKYLVDFDLLPPN